MENRRFARCKVNGPTADISDGCYVFSHCELSDISESGIRITNIPARLITKNKSSRMSRFSVVINDQNTSIKLELSPRWFTRRNDNSHITVGFEVVSAQDKWARMIKSYFSQEADVWGNRNQKYLRA